jgi:hypothetical protein
MLAEPDLDAFLPDLARSLRTSRSTWPTSGENERRTPLPQEAVLLSADGCSDWWEPIFEERMRTRASRARA